VEGFQDYNGNGLVTGMIEIRGDNRSGERRKMSVSEMKLNNIF